MVFRRRRSVNCHISNPRFTTIQRSFHNFNGGGDVKFLYDATSVPLTTWSSVDTAQRRFARIIEEVHTGCELCFKSTGELLAFLAQCVGRRNWSKSRKPRARYENELGVSLMLKVRVENLGQITILHIDGHIVVGPEIELLRKSVSSQTDAGAVVLDLNRVTRIDARGLGLLLELRGKLNQSGVKFRLMNVGGSIQQILRLTCLDTVFEISTEEEVRSGDSEELVLVF